MTVEIIAHRGFSARAPENTLASMTAAIAAGADAVEFDIRTAACGTPVLFHDTMLSRTTNGVGPLRRRTFAQLGALDAGRWFSPDFAGERIPSLQETLETLKGRIGRIYAEVKGFRELEDLDRIVRLTREAGMLDDVVFISLNWTLLDRMRRQQPDLAISYIVDKANEVEGAFARAKGDARALIDFEAELLLDDRALAGRCATEDIDVAVWTVDDPSQASELFELGVRRFTTNQVESLLAWKGSR